MTRISSRLARRAFRRHSAVLKDYKHALTADSCGCAMGARFLAAALVISITWYLWQWYTSAVSARDALIRIALWSFLAAAAGKLLGITIAKFRARHA